jgi:hypothetical protein
MPSSTADRADVTISLALKTLLMEDRDLFDARRWDTRVSRGTSMSWLVWELLGDKDAWLWRLPCGDADIGSCDGGVYEIMAGWNIW